MANPWDGAHLVRMRLSRQDVRLAIRSFARHPGFTITAVVSLALAIALNTTMYSVLDAMVKPNVDITQPDRFYHLRLWRDERRQLDPRRVDELLAGGMKTYDALLDQSSSAAMVTIEYGSRFTQRSFQQVTTNALPLYGVRPLRGRLFEPDDAPEQGQPRLSDGQPVIISARLADELSPDSPFPVGASISIDGVGHPVIGIIRRGAFSGTGNRADLFLAMGPSAGIIHLRPGVSRAAVEAELSLVTTRLAALTNEDPKYVRYELRPLVESQFKPQRFHYALIAAVLAVLLVACANLANLQLARGIGRSRELAVRAALGAARRDIIVQLLLESALLAAAGLVGGVLLTFWGVHILQSTIPTAIADFVIEPQISWRVFAVATITGVVSVLLVGLFPAVRVSRVDPNELLKSGAGTGANKRNRRQYGVLVAAEIAFSLALLSAAALVVRTAVQLRLVNMGYDTRPLATATLVLRGQGDTALNAASYENEILAPIRASSEVAAAAATFSRMAVGHAVTVNERGGTPHEYDTPLLGYSVTTADYFRTLHLPVIKGRNFPDGLASVGEVIVDQHTASRMWPGVDPIGEEIKLGEYKSNAPWLRVVGVVPDINDYNQLAMYNRSVMPSKLGMIYVSLTASDSLGASEKKGSMVNLMVRAKNDPERMTVALRHLLPHGGLVRFTWSSRLEDNLGITRQRARHDFVASIFLTFALMALALAALGIYGIVAHSVAERKRELGVRIALGASARNVLHAVLREGNVMALAGVAFGLLMTKYTAGWLHAFIFEDDEYNAPVFAAMAAILFVVALLSALWPALRATRIDPVESLRSE
jgi:putative ABC transport system permease protein